MTTIVKIGIGVAVAAVACSVVPALRGPYNRAKNTLNEKLNAEIKEIVAREQVLRDEIDKIIAEIEG